MWAGGGVVVTGDGLNEFPPRESSFFSVGVAVLVGVGVMEGVGDSVSVDVLV